MVRDNQELREKTQTENQAEVGDARPKGANISDRSKHQTWKLWRHAKNSHMSDNIDEVRHGVASVASQAVAAPGLLPRRGPPSTTSAGPFASACKVSGRDKRLNLADQEKESINILQWNAEGVWGKKEALKHRLHEQKIDVACLQETHLKNSHRFSIRGYQTFRKDRESGPKGGILILVKNDLPAIELDVEPGDQAEIQCIKIKGKKEITLFNCYCPPGKQLKSGVLGSINNIDTHDGLPNLSLN